MLIYLLEFNITFYIKWFLTRKKKNQHKRQLIQFNETLNDFVIGNKTIAGAIANETSELQTYGWSISFERIIDGENSPCQNQVFEKIVDDNFRKAVNNAVVTVKHRMHDAILTAMDNEVFQRVEKAVRLITGSSGQRPSSLVQNPDWRDFTGNTENVPLMSAASRIDLNVEQDGNDENRKVENFEGGEFPAVRLSFGRRARAHYSIYVELYIDGVDLVKI